MAKIEKFEKKGLFGLILNGKVLVDAQFNKVHHYEDYWTAIGAPGYFMFDIERDEQGNEIAIIEKKIED